MSRSKTTDGQRKTDLQTVPKAIREITGEGDWVTLDELVREKSLDSVTVEMVVGTIEDRSPVRATRIVMAVAWKLTITRKRPRFRPMKSDTNTIESVHGYHNRTTVRPRRSHSTFYRMEITGH